VEHVTLRTSDGHALPADVDGPARGPVGAVAVCHPHPQYGGDRHNSVVTALFDALAAAGFLALRFDFRSQFGGGDAERRDVVAALDALAERAPGAPLHLAGYSFGAAVALRTGDERVRSIVAVAPPLAMMPAGDPGVPTLVLVPEHDQFSPPAVAGPIVDAWSHAELRSIPMADHFLAGATRAVADQAISWLAASLPPTNRST
jgi:alpha/beta superfamily hydrolase